MNSARHRIMPAVLLFVILSALISAHTQITPTQDAYTDSSKPTTNFGAANTTGSIQTSYLQFDLSSIPSGYTDATSPKPA